MSRHKWQIIISVVTMLFLITGCTYSKFNPNTKVIDQLNQEADSKGDNLQSTNKLESDPDLVQRLEAEKGIKRVMVQVVEGEQRAVNVDIEIDNEQEMSADQLVEKYSKVIKEKYPDRTIDIIIAKDGKLLKQATLK